MRKWGRGKERQRLREIVQCSHRSNILVLMKRFTYEIAMDILSNKDVFLYDEVI